MIKTTKYSYASSLFFILSSLQYFFFQACVVAASNSCTPSSCGVLNNISYPFRLKDDPLHCGDRRFELVCENDVASFHLNSQKYFVKDINYANSTIRLVDASINSNDVCSFPTSSAYSYNFTYNYRLHGYPYYRDPYLQLRNDVYYDGATPTPTPIYLISCPNPLKDSISSPLLLFTDITHHCRPSNSTSYAYVKVGRMKVQDMPHMCELDTVAMTSWPEFYKDTKNVSLSVIHQSLLYGFELSCCIKCGMARTHRTWLKFRDFFINRLNSPLLIIPVILVMLCAAVAPPVMALLAFTAVVGLLTFIALQFYWLNRWPYRMGYNPSNSDARKDVLSTGFVSSIVMVFAPRFIFYLIVVWFLIYKFRRRHLSEFEMIESFLQSDVKLVPIRYSYSNIKKMTRNFRDKIGEGGFGSVYKGKLRSGNHVAIKMLEKSKANGQDFINEISTIGRIHHVNIVNLVGYCAQGSKRALVYDFMPNGSLEKYIFNRENKKTLSWDKKFEIIVGVARGIDYLHRGCDIQILHFDIKPHNILLDDKFIPKVSDFGLSKFCSTEKNTMTMTAARGTIGYVAPELISRGIGRVSYKADVYSFGMLLMEMMGLNRDKIDKVDYSSKYFPYWIYEHFNQGVDIAMENVDENDDSDVSKLVRKMTIVALWCIQMNPDDRPSMNKVLDMLEVDVDCLQIPKYLSQSAHMPLNEDNSWEQTAEVAAKEAEVEEEEEEEELKEKMLWKSLRRWQPHLQTKLPRIGGLMMYGVPNMKTDKIDVVQRRVNNLQRLRRYLYLEMWRQICWWRLRQLQNSGGDLRRGERTYNILHYYP